MGLDYVLFDFLTHAAVGAVTVLLLFFFVGVGMPRRVPAPIRRLHR